jgi:hypothetical protein
MAKTSTASFDNVGNPDPVIAPVSCFKIELREQGAAATTDYIVHAPTASDPGYRKLAGEATVFRALPGQMFQSGDTVGYLETVTGTVSFSLICE